MAIDIELKNVRLSFPRLFKAQDYQGDKNYTYEASFIIEPDSPAFNVVLDAYQKAAKEGWGSRAEVMLEQFKNNLQKTFFYKGDLKTYEGYEGNFIVKAKRKMADGAPAVANLKGQRVMEGEEQCPYAGCYVNAKLQIWPQAKGATQGMRCTLKGVQFFRDGDRFSGVSNVDNLEFDDLSDGADAPALTGKPKTAGGFV